MNILPEGIRKPLQQKDYRYFVTGQIVSIFSFWMQGVTSSWLAYQLTGSSALLGVVMFANLLPSLFFSPIGGIIADSFPKKYTIYATQSIGIFANIVMGILVLTDLVEVWHLVLSGFLIGSMISIESPVRNAYLIELVGRDQLRNAIALNSTIFNLGRMLGPAFGGFLIPYIGVGYLYIITGIGFSGICIALSKVSVMGMPEKDDDPTHKHSFLEGFQYAYEEKTIFYCLFQVAIAATCMTVISVLLPKVAVEILSGQSRLLGILHASTGIGALMSAMYLASSSKKGNLVKNMVAGNIFLIFGSFLFAFSTNAYLSIFALLATGAGGTLFMASTNTFIQLITPNVFRGRVMSLFTMMWMGLGIFGSAFAGYGGDKFGMPETLLSSSIFLTVCALFALPKIIKNSRSSTYI